MSFMYENGHIPECEDDELTRRLRALEWPAVDPQLKHECWLEFQERMRRTAPRRATLETGDRLEFSGRRAPMRGLVPAARLGVAGGWLRRRSFAGLSPSF
jgi:hypothetical protein